MMGHRLRSIVYGGNVFMKKRILQRFVLITGLILSGALLYSVPASAANCNAMSNQGGCPTVQSVQANGGSASINWAADMFAQTFASISGTRAATWGLYMVNNWSTSMNGHWFSGGTYTPILTVNNTDPARKADGSSGTDYCTNDPFYCTHEMMAARFYQKYGFSGVANVTLPSSWPAHRPPCMIFGAYSSVNSTFHTVFAPSIAEPCQPGFPGTVEPEPDPEWCGMSTSELLYEFNDLSPGDVNGKSLEKSATMTCSGAGVSYNLYLQNVSTTGRDKVSLGRGVTATVTANNQALQSNRTSVGASQTLLIKVSLSGVPTSTGPIGGVGILAVNYN
ncbi:hypothetical protein C8D90_105268 [Enterobacillus tribolii]|uniref:Type 1 fimbria pilin n=2 Tax=Enterobacillus tribolii TaxID=1487935 RepID=A0A370QQD3_9GAMM|nr:hypothetical protein C8D90_105268 [Enterobacillus tribolii]